MFDMCLFLFTLRWGQIVQDWDRAGSSIPVGVNKLAVIFTLADCISYTVKQLCRETTAALLQMFKCF